MNLECHPDRPVTPNAQLRGLRGLLGALRQGNRFYRARLEAAQLDEHIEDLAQFTSRMPLTTKDELVADQCDHPPYGTNLTFDLNRYCRFSQTSSTTAAPLRWLDTAESWSSLLDNWDQVFEACGVAAGQRIFFAFSFGPFLGFWTAFEAALRRSCLCIPGGGMSSLARLHVMIDNRVTALCCTPTYAIRLGEVARQEGLDLQGLDLRAIVVAGEPGGSVLATRAAIERRWPGATVYDHHGMTEVGPVSFQCPVGAGTLHIIEPAYLTEVIDPESLQPVDPGGTGELVLTTLDRVASPLLRYRTGDLVRLAAAPCRCGRSGTALEGGILGRLDDMVLVRGVNVYPSAVDQVVRACGGVAEYRVEVTTGRGLTELHVQIEPDEACPSATTLCERLEHDLRDAFQLRIPVSSVDALPRFEMKARRWLKRS